MPLRIRLSSTCCRCTRSPWTCGRSPGTSTSSFTCRVAASTRTSAATSPTSAPTSSRRVSSVCRLSRPRMRSMTLPARSSSVRMSARIARTSSRSGDGVLEEQLRRLGVAQDRPERLVDLVRQRRGELAHHRDAPRVRDLLPQPLRLLLGVFARGDVARGAAHQDRLARGVEFDTALGRDPAGRAIRQRHPVFRLVSAAARRPRAPSHCACRRRSRSSGCSRFRMASKSSALGRREAKQRPPLLARPDVVSREVPDPDAEVGGIDGQAHARLALAQPGLAGLKLVDELRRAQHVAAQLVPHHRDQAQVKRAEENGDRDVCPIDQRDSRASRAGERTRHSRRRSAPSGARLAAMP